MIFGTLARFITCDSGDESRGRMSFLSGAAEGLGVKGYTVCSIACARAGKHSRVRLTSVRIQVIDEVCYVYLFFNVFFSTFLKKVRNRCCLGPHSAASF